MIRLLICALVAVGCRSVTVEVTKPEFFGSDPVRLLRSYEVVKVGATTKQDLWDSGWDFDSQNVRHVPGPEAMRMLFGENVFQDGVQSAEKIDQLFSELNHYELIIVSYKDVTTKEDLYYFSRKRRHRLGDEILVFLVFKDDTVVYKTRDLKRLDERSVRHAFAEGVLKYLLPAAAGYGAAKITD